MDNTGMRRASRLGIAAGAAAVLAIGFGSPASAHGRTSASVHNDTLFVQASNQSDRLALRLAPGDQGTLQVDFGDDTTPEHSFDRATFSRIEVNLRAGNDVFRVDQANGAFADEALSVRAGAGNDNMDGGDGAELFEGNSGNDFADGNRGDDTGVMGAGNDTFRWDPGDGSDIIEGKSGFDTLDFNGAAAAENMSLSGNGRRALFLRDVGNIRMDMRGVERLDLTALGGADRVTIDDMTRTDFRKADVDLSNAGVGDGAADVVTVVGTQQPDNVAVTTNGSRIDVFGLKTTTSLTGSELADQLQVRTLAGNDNVAVDPAVNALIGVAVDLGAQ